jgi:UDP-N-acetylmuramoyl-L-alanyl-D-glutamate--2,6-diaminopimelate ligase
VPRDKAIASALGNLVTGDVLLIAGKGHETGQLIGNETLPFDDASVANNKIRTMREALQ